MDLVIADVEKEYIKNPELKKEEVKGLQKWVELQPHLPVISEMQTIHFLHSNNFNNKLAKKCIDEFFTVKSNCPEFFAKRTVDALCADVLLYTYLPTPTTEGYQVIYAKLLDNNAEKYNFAKQIKFFDMVTMLMLNQRGTSVGQVVIHDTKGIQLGHLTRINLFQFKKFFHYLQECMPVRIKGLHFINTGTVMEKLSALLKLFMKKELVEVLHMHTKVDTLYNFVPRECMPNEFEGGTAGSFKELLDKTVQDFHDNEAFFAAEEKQVIDEKQRSGKAKTEGFGVDGNFKKLSID